MNALPNMNNVNPAITITNLLEMNMNKNKLKDISHLKSFNRTLKPIFRFQMDFSTKTASYAIYVEIMKFNIYKVLIPIWSSGLSVALLCQ